MRGIDFFAREFTNNDMVLVFDYGAYSGGPLDSLSKHPGYSSHIESIAGRKVQIDSFESDMHFPKHFNANFCCDLTMLVECRKKSDYDKALKVFRSVKFSNNSIRWEQ